MDTNYECELLEINFSQVCRLCFNDKQIEIQQTNRFIKTIEEIDLLKAYKCFAKYKVCYNIN